MPLRELMNQLRDSPLTYVDAECPIALGAFLGGYECANLEASSLLTKLACEYQGPPSASACTRVFLRHPGPPGFEMILVGLQRIIDAHGDPPAKEGPMARSGFIPTLIDVIEQGRSGMMLGEPTVSWLANCWSGFLVGVEHINHELGAKQRSEVLEFEQWLCERYHEPSSRWQSIIRIYEGPCIEGLHAFCRLWRAFCVSRRGVTDSGA